ncbi:hypothetical protein [Jiella pelagia]|uniref:Uncharacterized protein n=1 Tax=Jiella pelagia TaxID=2986949 RepID=A0ABY7C881_9HYPH|nr:hypothetical protein [Jiella pelagia]WAP71020.1 hypothetical protein OH818_14300 [Jiella pelagia]
MALQKKGEAWLATSTQLSWVDAPDLLEDEALLQRLRANNDALEELRRALDAESRDFAKFIRRDSFCVSTEGFVEDEF